MTTARPSLLLNVAGPGVAERWSYLPLTEDSATDLSIAADVPLADAQRLQEMLLSDECSLARVDGVLCITIDQDFLASDCGDLWPEDTPGVVNRLRSHLLPSLASMCDHLPGVRLGIAHGAHLRRERPTALVAIPVGVADEQLLRGIVERIQDYAFA